MTHRSGVSRRSLLLGAGGFTALMLTGCNASADSGSGTESGPGTETSPPTTARGFSYTDARGKVIDLAAIPTVVVAQSTAAASLWDAGYQVKGAYGELKTTDGTLDFQAGNLDLSQLEVIGSTYGEFNLEKYAAMGPQLLIDMSFDDSTLWYVPTDSATKVEALAPTLGLTMVGKNMLEVIEEVMALAGQLGADTAAATATAKPAFDAAVDKIKAAVAAQPELTVLGISRTADKAYIANADLHPDFAFMKTLGVKFVDAGGKAGDYFTEISYEKLDAYAGDVVFDDARSYATKGDSDQQPTWRALAAVKADQIVEWKAAAPYSYASYGPLFTAYADALSSAQRVR